jgi:protein SCO1/2
MLWALAMAVVCSNVSPARADDAAATNPEPVVASPAAPKPRTRPDPIVDVMPSKPSASGTATGPSADPFGYTMVEAPSAIAGMQIIENLGKRMPLDVEFLDHDGKPFKMQQAFDGQKPVILAMVYFRCPMLCQLVMQKLTATINELDLTAGKDFQLVIASFDPTELPEVVKAQRQAFLTTYTRDDGSVPRETIERGVHFLATKSTTETRRFADAIGFPYRYLPESTEYSHGTVIFALTPDGTASRYIYGVQYPVKDLRLAVLEAGQGKIGTTIDRVLMWCFHWNSSSNSYVIGAFRWMQFGATLSMVIVGSVLALLWFGERRRRRARAMLGSQLGLAQGVLAGVGGVSGANGR